MRPLMNNTKRKANFEEVLKEQKDKMKQYMIEQGSEEYKAISAKYAMQRIEQQFIDKVANESVSIWTGFEKNDFIPLKKLLNYLRSKNIGYTLCGQEGCFTFAELISQYRCSTSFKERRDGLAPYNADGVLVYIYPHELPVIKETIGPKESGKGSLPLIMLGFVRNKLIFEDDEYYMFMEKYNHVGTDFTESDDDDALLISIIRHLFDGTAIGFGKESLRNADGSNVLMSQHLLDLLRVGKKIYAVKRHKANKVTDWTCAHDIESRINQHNQGYVKSIAVKSRDPYEVHPVWRGNATEYKYFNWHGTDHKVTRILDTSLSEFKTRFENYIKEYVDYNLSYFNSETIRKNIEEIDARAAKLNEMQKENKAFKTQVCKKIRRMTDITNSAKEFVCEE